MMQRTLTILVVALSLSLAACAGKRTKPTTSQTPTTESGTGAETSGVDSTGAAAVDESGEGVAGPQEGLLARRIIYFDYDSSDIRGEGTSIVGAHARHLSTNANVRIRLEGHTDERGSREYNIGLGERRGQAVRRALMLQGATDAQVSTVSYGEERPAAAGMDETAFSQNRRVEIVYLN